MNEFGYVRPDAIDEVLELVGPASPPYAGGTDMLTRIKVGLDQPERVVDIKGAGMSNEIDEADDHVTFGALTTLAAIERSDAVVRRLPALAEAASQAATPQIRHRATIAGNLLQRPRCWYFRDPQVSCWLKGGEDCPARLGRNEHHAIFDSSPCAAVHPSDLATCLVAHDAEVTIADHDGEHSVRVDELFRPPTEGRRRETVLAPGALITSIRVPAPPHRRSAYRKAMDRAAWAFALVGVAAVADIDSASGRVDDLRIVLSGVANVPHAARSAADSTIGTALDDHTIERAAAAAVDGSQPLSRNHYKQQLVVALVRDALTSLREPTHVRAAMHLNENEPTEVEE